MSYDVGFQRFVAGAASPGGGDVMSSYLEPHVVTRDPERSFLYVEVEDGCADVYLDESDMMVNHAGGVAMWDVLVAGARAAGWSILLPDGPACLTDEQQRHELPRELAGNAVVVASGRELIAVIESL